MTIDRPSSEEHDRGEEETRRQEIYKRIEAQYGPFDSDVKDKVDISIRIIEVKCGGIDQVRGKRILDLGCGSTISPAAKERMKTIQSIEDKDKQRELFESWRFVASSDSELWGAKVEDTPSRVFEPWFCRVLSELGAEPVGIDIGNLDDEKFEHYNRDLSRKGALDFLPDQTFDFINATQLLTSPSNKRMGNEGHEIIARMKNELQTQARRLLKKGGSIISYGLSGIDDIGS